MSSQSSTSNAGAPCLVQIDALKPHPRQAVLFGDISELELAALAADIAENGLKVPIDILSDGTIIAGHQRVRAVALLKRTEILAIVRHDLDAVAADKAFIQDKLLRFHMGPMALARCCKTLIEIESSNDDAVERPQQRRLNRETLAARLKSLSCRVSGRTVDRYLALLKLPRAVQDAIDAKRLPMAATSKILCLRPDALDRLAERCRTKAPRAELLALLRGEASGPRHCPIRVVIEAVGRVARMTSTVRDAVRTRADEDPKLRQLIDTAFGTLTKVKKKR
jgi:hypothetical protein